MCYVSDWRPLITLSNQCRRPVSGVLVIPLFNCQVFQANDIHIVAEYLLLFLRPYFYSFHLPKNYIRDIQIIMDYIFQARAIAAATDRPKSLTISRPRRLETAPTTRWQPSKTRETSWTCWPSPSGRQPWQPTRPTLLGGRPGNPTPTGTESAPGRWRTTFTPSSTFIASTSRPKSSITSWHQVLPNDFLYRFLFLHLPVSFHRGLLCILMCVIERFHFSHYDYVTIMIIWNVTFKSPPYKIDLYISTALSTPLKKQSCYR